MAIFSAIIAGLGAAGFTGAVTVFGLSPALSGALIAVGRAALFNTASRLIMGSQKAPRQQVQSTIAQAAAPRIRGYGTFLLGGVRTLFEAKNGTLHQVVASHHGPITQVVEWQVDGQPVTVDVAGVVTSGPAAGYVTLQARLSGDGGDYAPARAAFPTIWTTGHRMAGQATFYARFRAPKLSIMSKVFPNQHETPVAMVAQLSQVLDPRTMTVGHTDLTGPVALDFLTHPDGMRIPLAQVDTANFAAFTNLCDQAVPLKAGGSEKRYRCWGYYSLEDAPIETMARILATADAQCFMTAEGKVGIMGGTWAAPDVTITSDDIISLTLTDGFDEFTAFNVLKGKFTSPDHRFQEAECDELVDAVALATQPERVDTLEVDMCPSHAQMRRLMKAYQARQNRRWTGTLRTNLVGLKARFPAGTGRHVIRVVYEEMGIDLTFEVLGHAYSVAEKMCEIPIASLENPYGWDAVTEEGRAPAPLDDLAKPSDAPLVPTGLTLSLNVVAVNAATNGVQIVAQVNDPGREGLQLLCEFKEIAFAVWQPMLAGVGDLRAYTGIVRDAAVYSVRASWSGFDVFGTPVSITTVANPTAPAVPTGFGGSESGGTVTLNWTNGGAGYFRTRVYRSATVDFNDAALIATVTGLASQPSSYSENPGAGTWRYWLVTINASSIESSPVGPQTFTI